MNITKKKTTHRHREQTSSYQCVGGDMRVGELEVQIIGYKIGYKDVLYSMGNTANIL